MTYTEAIHKEDEHNAEAKAKDKVIYQTKHTKPWRINQENNMKTTLILGHLYLSPSKLLL